MQACYIEGNDIMPGESATTENADIAQLLYNAVLIVGAGISQADVDLFIECCEEEQWCYNYCVIRANTLAEIRHALDGNLDDGTIIFVDTHGGVRDGVPVISLDNKEPVLVSDLFEILRISYDNGNEDIENTGPIVHALWCKNGAANKIAYKLGVDAQLFTYTNETKLFSRAQETIGEVLALGGIPNLVCPHPDTRSLTIVTTNDQSKDEDKFTFRKPQQPVFEDNDLRIFLRMQQDQFNDFLFSHYILSYPPFSYGDEALRKYRRDDFISRAADGDLKGVKAYMRETPDLVKDLIEDALCAAVCHGRKDVTRYFLNESSCPLEIAFFNTIYARDEASLLANMLIGSGANVNCQYKGGKTLLHYVASRGLSDLADTLIVAGADLSIRDGAGRTALDDAMQQGSEEGVETLLKAGARLSRAELKQAKSRMQAGSEPAIRVAEAYLTLRQAVDDGDMETLGKVEWDLVDADSKHPGGKFLLEIAFDNRNLAVAKELLCREAYMHARYANGETVLERMWQKNQSFVYHLFSDNLLPNVDVIKADVRKHYASLCRDSQKRYVHVSEELMPSIDLDIFSPKVQRQFLKGAELLKLEPKKVIDLVVEELLWPALLLEKTTLRKGGPPPPRNKGRYIDVANSLLGGGWWDALITSRLASETRSQRWCGRELMLEARQARREAVGVC